MLLLLQATTTSLLVASKVTHKMAFNKLNSNN